MSRFHDFNPKTSYYAIWGSERIGVLVLGGGGMYMVSWLPRSRLEDVKNNNFKMGKLSLSLSKNRK